MRPQLAIFLLAASCFGQTTLRQYLNLSGAQVSSIVQLNQAYLTASFANLTNTNTLKNELSGLLTIPATDPKDLGDRAVAIEYLRRDQAAMQSALQTAIANLLTPAQMTLVQNLIASSILLPLAADASCAYLVEAQVIGVLTLVPTLAAKAPACKPSIFPISVREYLSLSNAQIAAIYQASDAYNDLSARRQNRIADLNQQIQTSPADPTVLGLAYLEIASIKKELIASAANLRAAAMAQLTPEQQAKLKPLQDAQDLQDSGVIAAALNCNIAVLPVGSSNLANGFLTSCFL